LHWAVVLYHRRAARDLEYRVLVINTVEADIPSCPVNAVRIAADIHRHQSAKASGTCPAGKARNRKTAGCARRFRFK
jgi:hypothetical protein